MAAPNRAQVLEAAEQAVARLKVFPLPSVVLFPGVGLPLNIFEPRYLQMVEHCLAADQIFAMASLEPGWEPHYHGAPELRPMVCVGRIMLSERQGDGRMQLVLEGVARARVLKELPPDSARLYREVQAQWLPDAPYDGPEESALRQALVELVTRLPDEVGGQLNRVSGRVHGGAFADVVASAVVTDLQRRYQLLEELDVGKRLRMVTDDVSSLLARFERRPGEPLN